MKSFHEAREQKARRRALHYVEQLFSGGATREQTEKIAAWRLESATNAQQFDAVLNTWSQLEDLAEDADVQAWCETGPQTGASRHWRYSLTALAATVLVVVAVFLMPLWDDTAVPVNNKLVRYTTEVGEQQTVQLSDGSQITLNTNSHLLVDFTGAYRRAILDRGEVYFDIAADPGRPFKIEFGTQAVTVLGTQFNVRKLRSRITVAVAEGLVALHPKTEVASAITMQGKSPDSEYSLAEHHRIAAGDVAIIDEFGEQPLTIQRGTDISKYASWRDGRVEFRQEPLYKVVQEINRYTLRKLVIEDMRIMELKVSAVLHIQELDTVLAGLEASLPVEIRRYPENIVLTKK